MEKIAVMIGAIVIAIAGLLLLSFLLSWPVYMLWNGCLLEPLQELVKCPGYRRGALRCCLDFCLKLQ